MKKHKSKAQDLESNQALEVEANYSPTFNSRSLNLGMVASGVLLIAFVLLGALRERFTMLHAFDTGLYLQLLNNLEQYGDFASSITGERNFLAHHFQPIIVLALPFHGLLPSATTLFALDALAVFASVVLLARHYKKQVPVILLAALLVSVVLHPTIANRMFHSFVPETFALPLLTWQALTLASNVPPTRQKILMLVIVQLLAGSCKETLWLVNAGVAALSGWRWRSQRPALWTMMALNLCIFVLLFFVWMPTHSQMPSYYALRYYQNDRVEGSGTGALIQSMLANLISARSFGTFVMDIVALSGIIPFVRLSTVLFAAVPGIALILTTSHPPIHDPGNQYQILVLPFLWVSALESLRQGIGSRPLPNLSRYLPVFLIATPLTVLMPEILLIAGKISATPWAGYIAKDMEAIRSEISKKKANVIADANLQPRLADFRNVTTLLEFTGNPHKVSEEERGRITDVVTVFDPRILESCGVVQKSEADSLNYDYEAFYRYCLWIKSNGFSVTHYPESHLHHFHRPTLK